MKTITPFAIALAAVALGLAGCATEPEQPAPQPAPVAAPAAPLPTFQPAPAPEPKTVAATEAPRNRSVLTVTSTELFEFDKATLTPQARAQLDREVVSRAKDFGSISAVQIDGHADYLGSPQYNQVLSEKRAGAIQAYLVSRGFDASKIEVLGSGEAHPVKSCPELKDRKALVECLAPNRRVVVEVKGTSR